MKFIQANDTTFQYREPKQYKYDPKEDITPYEVALLLPVIVAYKPWMDLETASHWNLIKRHFVEVK